MISNTSSKWRSSSRRARTASACRRVPFVKISLRPGNPSIAAPSAAFWRQGRMINLVHEIEKVVGFHAVLGHQPPHRGAVTPVVILLQAESLFLRDLKVSRDVVANALVHLLPQVEVMRIERVVEVEDPGLHMSEGARRATS